MTLGRLLLLLVGVAASVEVVVFFAALAWKLQRLPRLEDGTEGRGKGKGGAGRPPELPSLTVVIAARDQEGTLSETIRSLLRQDVPDLEVVVVDDRSADATGRIARELAAEDPRVVPVRVDALPAGWLGKVHALHAGTEHASGRFLLYTDADVLFAPGALRRGLEVAEGEDLDHLTVFPRILPGSLWQQVAVAALTAFGLLLWVPVRFGRRGSSRCTGIGSFNLVRRQALDRTAGFGWLRMEVLDDRGLGLMLHRAGCRGAVRVSTEAVSVAWYATLRQMVQGLEKNLFAGVARYDYRLAALHAAHLAALALGPLLVLVQPSAWPAGAAVVLAHLGFAWIAARRLQRSPLPFLLFPIGVGLIDVALLASAVAFWRRGGVAWRGTHYPAAELRAGQRVRSTVLWSR